VRAAARLLALVGLAAALGDASAQELYGLAGLMRADSPAEHSYAWLFSYHQDLGEHLAASFSWQNEGHVTGHHRDGHSVQLWAKTRAFAPQLTLAAGVGPYRFYDTTLPESGDGHSDDHGYGVLYSLAATWSTAGRWLLQARLDRVLTRSSLDTTEFLLGAGYKLDRDDSSVFRGTESRAAAKRDEVTAFVGATIVNSFDSERDIAASVEYRHAFGPVLRGSIAWLDEGKPQLIQRNGVVAQAWLEPSFSGDLYTLGIGLGAYIATDETREGNHGPFASGILTMTASYHIGSDWTARFSWNRIASNYDRDTDVLLAGIGYRF
jgi:hypothetical protein